MWGFLYRVSSRVRNNWTARPVRPETWCRDACHWDYRSRASPVKQVNFFRAHSDSQVQELTSSTIYFLETVPTLCLTYMGALSDLCTDVLIVSVSWDVVLFSCVSSFVKWIRVFQLCCRSLIWLRTFLSLLTMKFLLLPWATTRPCGTLTSIHLRSKFVMFFPFKLALSVASTFGLMMLKCTFVVVVLTFLYNFCHQQWGVHVNTDELASCDGWADNRRVCRPRGEGVPWSWLRWEEAAGMHFELRCVSGWWREFYNHWSTWSRHFSHCWRREAEGNCGCRGGQGVHFQETWAFQTSNQWGRTWCTVHQILCQNHRQENYMGNQHVQGMAHAPPPGWAFRHNSWHSSMGQCWRSW